MKNFTFLSLLAGLLLSFGAIAQKQQEVNPFQGVHEKCGTMIHLNHLLATDPNARATYERNMAMTNAQAPSMQSSRNNGARLTGIVTVPVVFHIVGVNPWIVTDADCQKQIDRLNLDYGGTNPDSTNAVGFYPVRGHSLMRFTLAKRTPTGAPTGGVERRSSSTSATGGAPDPIKRTALGGLDAWDPSGYFNVWVGLAPGLLGYATFPGTGNAIDQGVVCAFEGFGDATCYANPAFAKGRTLSHEAGHYFGLYHINGDENACAGDDFRQLTGTCLLPAGLFNPPGQGNTAADIGDTPNQTSLTSGCPPPGPKYDACSPAPGLGVQFQNYMDYTDDACYSMFTNKQIARAEWVLENCRSGLIASTNLNGVSPVTASLEVGTLDVVNPGGTEWVYATPTTCPGVNTSYPPLSTCVGSTFTPRVRIINNGTAVLNSISVDVTVNTAPLGTTATYTGLNLRPGQSTVLVHNTPATYVANTPFNLRWRISAPNGGVDTNPVNDTISYAVSGGGVAPTALSENFETGTTFPPAGWSVQQDVVDAYTWARKTGVTMAPSGGTACAWINLYAYSTANRRDILVSPIVNLSAADSAIVSFDYAFRQYGTSATFADTLQVVVSPNCGSTWNVVWSKGGADLTSYNAGASSTAEFNPTASNQWKNIQVDINSQVVNNPAAVVGFRTINKYGNNIFLDNINFTRKVLLRRDISPIALPEPSPYVCLNTNRPNVNVRNFGRDTINSFKVKYVVTNTTTGVIAAIDSASWSGVLPPSAPNNVVNVQLNNVTGLTPGSYSIQATTSIILPAGGDQIPANDVITKTFTVLPTVNVNATLPLKEGFDLAAFPPNNWEIRQTPVDAITWTRTDAAFKSGVASAYINNYNYAANGRRDMLVSPLLNFTGADSSNLSFDLSAVTYSYPGSSAIPLDTLEVMVTTDCNKTFRTVYKKWGNELQTVLDPNFARQDEFFPTYDFQWRKESIDMTQLLGASSNFQFAFRNTTNFENNIFIDNVMFGTKVVSQRLKNKGYMVTPNPTYDGRLVIQHYPANTDLRGIALMNAVGQVLKIWNLPNGGENTIQIDVTSFPAGIYNLQMTYTNKVVVERVLIAHQ